MVKSMNETFIGTNERKLLKKDELAVRLEVTTRTVNNLMKRKLIPLHKTWKQQAGGCSLYFRGCCRPPQGKVRGVENLPPPHGQARRRQTYSDRMKPTPPRPPKQDIDEAKRRLPLPQLMEKIGDGAHAKKTVSSPFREDKHASFSVFQKTARGSGKITRPARVATKFLTLKSDSACQQKMQSPAIAVRPV